MIMIIDYAGATPSQPALIDLDLIACFTKSSLGSFLFSLVFIQILELSDGVRWTKRHSRGGRVVTFALSQTDTVRGAGAFNSAGNSSRVYDT